MCKKWKESGFCLNHSYCKLPLVFYKEQSPASVPIPRLVKLNSTLAKELGLNLQWLTTKEGVSILSGNQVIPDTMPIAQAYAGHQFGHFTMLGDGRAVLLGEQMTPNHQSFDIQIKGAGRTPYSRGGDGKAVLGPMLREYLISEAMYHLNIPTTRSLAVLTTGETIFRERENQGALLVRTASSHIRVGTFEYASKFQNQEALKALADYTIQRHFQECKGDYYAFLEAVIKKQAFLISKWMLVGFIHGVMNTDNVTISGETIDYGPCAFMDAYDENTVFSSIDTRGRYAYGNQPFMIQWDLARFAEALLPLLDEDKEQALSKAGKALDQFVVEYEKAWLSGMKDKLGLIDIQQEDETLIQELFTIMAQHRADFTNTFYALTIQQPDQSGMEWEGEWKLWYEKWMRRLEKESDQSLAMLRMKKSNPVVIPRNHYVETALNRILWNDDFTLFEELLQVLSKPYEEFEMTKAFQQLPQDEQADYKTYCGT